MEAFWNGELEAELLNRSATECFPMGNGTSREDVMKTIDVLRSHEIYPHPEEHCSEVCRTRGKDVLDKSYYRETSNLRCTLIGIKIVDHSDLVGALPVGTAPTTSSF